MTQDEWKDWTGFVAAARTSKLDPLSSDLSDREVVNLTASEWGLTVDEMQARVLRLDTSVTGVKEKPDQLMAVCGYPSLVHRAHNYADLTEDARIGFFVDLKYWTEASLERYLTPDELSVASAMLRGMVPLMKPVDARDFPEVFNVHRQMVQAQRRVDGALAVRRYDATPNPYQREPWTEAVEMQFKALRTLEKAARILDRVESGKVAETLKWPYQQPVIKNDLAVNWRHDVGALRIAESFSWLDPALAAVLQASESIPTNCALEVSDLPRCNGQGFYWFRPALQVRTNDFSPVTNGLLWGTSVRLDKNDPAVRSAGVTHGDLLHVDDLARTTHLVLSAYTVGDARPAGGASYDEAVPVASAMWRWYFGETIEMLLERSAKDYESAYGQGGPWQGQDDAFAKDGTLQAIEKLSRFFLASCAWLSQEILLVRPQHVERHRRKAFVRDHRLPIAPRLNVVALRQAHYDRPPDAGQEAQAMPGGEHRKYDACQWVVKGHWRQQPYGPGRSGRKAIYINPFLKGPEGKPLRQKQTVYAVMR